MGHLTPRRAVWLLAIVVLALSAGEWLRSPGVWPVLLSSAAAVVLVGDALRRGDPDAPPWRMLLTVWCGAALAMALGATQVHRSSLIRDWSHEESRLGQRAQREASRALDALQVRLGALASRAALLPSMPRERAFDALGRMRPRSSPEVSLALLDSAGRPTTWAGLQRVFPVPGTDSVALRRTPFYAVLEVRRHRADGGVAVATALLSADDAAPGDAEDLAGTISDDLGIRLSFEPTSGRQGETVWPASGPVLELRVVPRARDRAVLDLMDRAGLVLALLLLGLLVGAASSASQVADRYLILALLPWLAVRAPLDKALGLEDAFSPALFRSPVLGPFSSSAGVLTIVASLGFFLAVGVWRSQRPRGRPVRVLAWLLMPATPYLLRELARGITPPAADVPLSLWLTWHMALLAAAGALLTMAAALLRAQTGQEPSPWPAALGAGFGLVAAGVGVVAYTGSPAWPTWYTALWLPAIVLATRPAPRLWTIVAIGTVAGAGATLLTWGAALTGRTNVALHDVAGLGREPDPLAEPLLVELGRALRETPSPDAAVLYRAWRGSALRREGYPARLTIWDQGRPAADLVLDALAIPDSVLAALAAEAVPGRELVTHLAAFPGLHHVVTVQLDSLRTLTVAIGPRSVLIPPAPLGRLLETGPTRSTLYRLSLGPVAPDRSATAERWRREGWAMRTSRAIVLASGPADVNVLIPIGRPGSIQVRGALLILIDLAVIWILWVSAERAAGATRHPRRWRRLIGSYQARLALALGLFFLAPSVVLAILSLGQLRAEAGQTQDLVLQRVLRDASPVVRFGAGPADSSVRADIGRLARRVDADLGFYRDGVLVASSDPLLADLAVFPPLLDAQAYHSIHLDGDLSAAPHDGSAPTLAGYAIAGLEGGAGLGVLATVAPTSDLTLQERQADVGYILVLVTLLGMLAALGAARTAARALSQPVADLRESALAFGRGDAIPVRRGSTPMEFAPVFEAFGRMASDVRASQAALEAARLRLELVLATASTGVIALDAEGRVLLANLQAEEAVGRALPPGQALGELLAPGWDPLRWLVGQMLSRKGEPESGIEVEAGGRRFVVRAAGLAGELGGLVLALTDVTETTIAARVLAWADVANQVAHAIKNPLTPLRLGMQHLARVSQEHPEQLDATLRETSSRILAEIDRLDAIARAFSRFAAPSEAGRPLEMVPVGETLKEVAALYHLAPGVTVVTAAPPGATVPARRDELTEVLLNLCDNAGNAGARTISMRLEDGVLEVHDDGRGIPSEHMGKIFEPRFSTTSSGSGLGLAIVRRVVEGWGGSVSVESQAGKGTTFRIRFGPALNVPPAGSV